MNRRITIAFVFGLIMLLLIWLCFNLVKPGSPENRPSAKLSQPNQQAVDPMSQGQPQPVEKPQGSRFNALTGLSLIKIVFYGKVVDQDGKPLPDVKVIGKTGSMAAFYTEEHRDYRTTTNANGLFVFDQFKGHGLVIELAKDGYKFASNHRHFLYAAIASEQKTHQPDPANPVVFTMFKSMGAEPMIHYATDFMRIPADGTGIEIDLRTGKVVAQNGDLAVAMLWEGDVAKNDFTWSAKLLVDKGGILEGGRDQLFVAPSDGYQHSLYYRFETKDRGKTLPQEYYVRLGENKGYARIQLFMQPADTESTVKLAVWLNPSGSRNLEYDPAKRINP